MPVCRTWKPTPSRAEGWEQPVGARRPWFRIGATPRWATKDSPIFRTFVGHAGERTTGRSWRTRRWIANRRRSFRFVRLRYWPSFSSSPPSPRALDFDDRLHGAIHFAVRARSRPMRLDKKFFERRRPFTVNPKTHQKYIFCARLLMGAGLALHICPGQPGAAS